MDNGLCYFCQDAVIFENQGSIIYVVCPTCGEYEITRSFLRLLESDRGMLDEQERRSVSRYIRERIERGQDEPVFISIGVIEGLTGKNPAWRI